jgi:hypothetical protein
VFGGWCGAGICDASGVRASSSFGDVAMSKRVRLVEHDTTSEDLAALSRLSWFLVFLKHAEVTVSPEMRERAASDYNEIAHCYKLLEEMLVTGLSPVGE